MKNTTLIKTLLLSFIFVSFSCKKQNSVKLKCYDPGLTCYHFDTSEITQTNYFGRVVGVAKPDQWTLQPISQATDFDKKVFEKVYVFDGTTNPNYPEKESFDIHKYNQNCTIPDTNYFTIVCYPNPISKALWPDSSGINGPCEQYFKISTNLNVKCSYSIRVDKFGDMLGSESLILKPNLDGTSITNILSGIRSTGYPAPVQRDYIVYYFIYTLEGCAYFGKGNVIGC